MPVSQKPNRKLSKKNHLSRKRNRRRKSAPHALCFPMSCYSINLFFNVKDTINPIEPDGNCLFRAVVGDQVQLYSMDYTKYIANLREDGTMGDNYVYLHSF